MTNPAIATAIVITTIAAPTPAVCALGRRMGEFDDARMIVIGDRKGPPEFQLPNADFYPLANQADLGFRLTSLLPVGHYARKNIGYLIAARSGATQVYETDDDNAPMAHWARRELVIEADAVNASGWVNVYRMFSDETIWPRGFPLGRIRDAATYNLPKSPWRGDAYVQQGLADGSPDVDAVWRLVMDRELRFHGGRSVWLGAGAWCPFNSQSTWWWPVAYPLMYLPSFCSFRMTDIWRSFIAQRCLWELGSGVAFHAAEVVQDRNPHDLMRDFADEVPGYLGNEKIVRVLEQTSLQSGPAEVSANLVRCYESLVAAGVIEAREMALVRAWVQDLKLA